MRSDYLRAHVLAAIFAIAGAVLAASSAGAESPRWQIPLHFEPIRSDSASGVFAVRGSNYAATIDRDGAVLFVPVNSGGLGLRIGLAGAERSSELQPEEDLPARINYFLGKDPSRWRTDVPTYARVIERNAWPGIDVAYHGNGRDLEYDFVAAKQANPNFVRLAIDGADSVRLDERGDLVIRVGSASVRLIRPRVYQSIAGHIRIVGARYRLRRGRKSRHGESASVGVDLARYDRDTPLTIDPIVRYSSFLGGRGKDAGNAIAIDNAGKVYVAGTTQSSDFPIRNACTTCVPKAGVANGVAFVAKFDPSQSGAKSLLYATYLGGSGDSSGPSGDSANAVAVDPKGNIYIAGVTTSSDFPTTQNAFQGSCPGSSGCNTAFVSELNPSASSASQLVYSSYLGGTTSEVANGVAAPSPGTVYVAGATSSGDFPITPDAFQQSCGDCSGATGGFVAQLNTQAFGKSSLTYGSYLSGGTSDVITSLAASPTQPNAFAVAGFTSSSDFPTTPNAFQTSCPACTAASNAFVSLITLHHPPAQQLAYSTFLGGSGKASLGLGDRANSIALEGQSISVAGAATSSDFPIAAGFQSECPSAKAANGCASGFVARLIPAFSLPGSPLSAQLAYSTFVGGSNAGDVANAIASDITGDVYVTGTTMSSDLPVTRNASQKHCSRSGNCTSSAFIMKLNPFTGGEPSLIYSSYLGAGRDQGTAVTVDSGGNAYATGITQARNFPVTRRAFQSAYGGGGDAFVAGFDLVPRIVVKPTSLSFGNAIVFGHQGQSKRASFQIGNPAGKHGMPVAFRRLFQPSAGYSVTGCPPSLAPGKVCNVVVAFQPSAPGPVHGSLTISDDAAGGLQVVTLNGTGVQGKVAISPGKELNFGSIRIGRPSVRKFVSLRNKNPIAMGIQGVAVTGTGGANFKIESNSCGIALGADRHCKVGIVFKPESAGKLNASLSITDDAVGSPQQIPLTGIGK